MIKVRHTDYQFFAYEKKNTVRLHERNVLQVLSIGS